MAELADVVTRANALKDEGNGLLSQNKFALAAERYSQAIALAPSAIFFANRAQANIKLENYGLAIEDANEALKLDPNYIKAYYRRGSAMYALNRLKLALKDFKAVVKIAPKDPDANKKMKACEKAYREEQFSKAIEYDDQPQMAAIDIDAITVDASYDGPHLTKDESGKIVIDADFVAALMDRFRNQKLLHRKYVLHILSAAIQYFETQPSLMRLSMPTDSTTNEINGSFIVCGDTHGQFFDLCNIFSMGGMPSNTNRYLFNGDFVDRGSFSFETIMTLLCMKLSNPESLYLTRGNHETKNMNKVFGFTGEIMHKFDKTVMDMFSKVFGWLPLAAVLQEKVFVVHGGLSTEPATGLLLEHIEAIKRNREPGESGLMVDLLWADPQPARGRSPSKRGLGFSFGPNYTESFLAANGLQLLIRSHEMQEEGYSIDHNGQCITLFSAPNYCDQMGNKGAFIRFTNAAMTPAFTKFEAVPHPNIPPMCYAGNMFGV